MTRTAGRVRYDDAALDCHKVAVIHVAAAAAPAATATVVVTVLAPHMGERYKSELVRNLPRVVE